VYRFVLRPKWIIGHLLATTLVISFVAAGFWQLSRHEWRSDLNARIETQADLEVLGVDGIANAAAADLDLRIAEVAGTWAEADILVWNRSFDGQPGCHIVTPLLFENVETGAAEAVVVNRGWLDLARCENPDRTTFRPDTTRVVVAGQLSKSQQPGRFQASDPATGVLESMLRIDIGRIDQQIEPVLTPVYLVLAVSEPRETTLLPVAPRSASVGPHLGYAVQWFLFAAVGIVGYPLVLRKQATSPELDDAGNTCETVT